MRVLELIGRALGFVVIAGLMLLMIYGIIWVLWSMFIIPVIIEPYICETFSAEIFKEGHCDGD